MGTIVFNKKEFLKQIAEIIDDEEYVVFTNDVHGTIKSDTKKTPAKRVPFAFGVGAFDKKGSVEDILNSKLGAMVILGIDKLDEKFRKGIEEEKADSKDK